MKIQNQRKKKKKDELTYSSKKKLNKKAAPTPKSSSQIILSNNDELLKKFEDTNQKIDKIIDFLEDYITEIESTKGFCELKNLINEFKLKYYPYKDIKRFSIPVIGVISSGKSTILNLILELKKTLQMDQDITTKCICIIRHQKGFKKAKIYKVKIERRGEKILNFIEDEEIKENNVAEVIAERNKKIAEDKIGCHYHEYFLIIKYDIPIFRGEFEKYADLFEFMDVPGLNEVSDIKNTTTSKNQEVEGEQNNLNSIDNNFYFRQIFPLIIMNVKFSLFIFSAENYGKSNAKQIISNYLEGGNEREENEKKEDNKCLPKANDICEEKEQEEVEEEVEEVKQKFNTKEEEEKAKDIETKKIKYHREQRKYCSHQSFNESIFILNKIDTVEKEDIERTNEDFKKYIEDNFNDKQIIRLDNDNELPLDGRKENDEISKLDSFENYLKFYIIHSKYFDEHTSYFYEYIIKIMNNDLGLKLRESEDEEDEEEENEDEDKGKKLENSGHNKDTINKYKELANICKKNSQFTGFIKISEYLKLKKIFKEKKHKYSKTKDLKIENMLKNKMIKAVKDYFSIEKYQGMVSEIISQFKIDQTKSIQAIKKRFEQMEKEGKGIGNPKQSIKNFKKYIND